MISRLQVKNFQSLKDIDLELGLFTVIVGNSSSGKSSLVRALKALTSNARGSSFVTSGEDIAVITAESQDWKVTLEKGKDHGTYRAVDKLTGTENEYTKLGGEVPEDVSSLIKIQPLDQGLSVNFASQHDKPYLLDASGQVVARTLGDLTNVSVILEAVREANRRRLAANSILKVRKIDLENLKKRLPEFSKLKLSKEAILLAESFFNEAEKLNSAIEKLSSLLHDIQSLEDILGSSDKIQLPDYEELNRAFMGMVEYRESLREIGKLQNTVKVLDASREKAIKLEESLTKEYKQTLLEAGECPVCEQTIVEK